MPRTRQQFADQLREQETIKESSEQVSFLLHDIARVHALKVAVATVAECDLNPFFMPFLIPQILAPSKFYLFPKLKPELQGRHFNSDDVIDAVEA